MPPVPHNRGGRGSNQYATKGVSVGTQRRTASALAQLTAAEDPDSEQVAWAFHPDRAAWAAAGITRSGVAHRWEQAGFTAATARDWLAHGYIDPVDAAGWGDAGISPSEASLWKEIGFSALQASEWSGFGHDVRSAKDWLASWAMGTGTPAVCPLGEATDFMLYGFLGHAARLYHDADVGPDEAAREWESHGFTVEDRIDWAVAFASPTDTVPWVAAGFRRDNGYEAWLAAEYAEKGVPPEVAILWVRTSDSFDVAAYQAWTAAGFTDPEEATRWRNRGLDPQAARAKADA